MNQGPSLRTLMKTRGKKAHGIIPLRFPHKILFLTFLTSFTYHRITVHIDVTQIFFCKFFMEGTDMFALTI
jgi:hypothetical protein